MKKYVYLGGFIEGLRWEKAFEWREKAEILLKDIGISCYNPVVNVPESFRTNNGIITFDNVSSEKTFNEVKNGKILTADMPDNIRNEIFHQSLFHLKQSNICLFNLKWFKIENYPIGTFWEISTAVALGKLTVAFDEHPSLVVNPFIQNLINLNYDSLDESLDYIVRL